MYLFIKIFLLLTVLLVISFRIMVSVEDQAIASLKNNSWENSYKNFAASEQIYNSSIRFSTIQYSLTDWAINKIKPLPKGFF